MLQERTGARDVLSFSLSLSRSFSLSFFLSLNGSGTIIRHGFSTVVEQVVVLFGKQLWSTAPCWRVIKALRHYMNMNLWI